MVLSRFWNQKGMYEVMVDLGGEEKCSQQLFCSAVW